MICATCGKDSTNRRVCPFCFTPYAADEPNTGSARRSTTGSTPVVGGSWPGSPGRASQQAQAPKGFARLNAFVQAQSPVVRWSALGIVVVLLLWAFTGGADTPPTAPAGMVQAPPDNTPMTREQALEHIRRTRETAWVETQADEVFVTFAGATFPLEPAAQLTLVRRFVRADELVEGRRRRIYFYAPSGKMYAQSDGVTGITVKQ